MRSVQLKICLGKLRLLYIYTYIYIHSPPASSRARFLGHTLLPVLPQVLLLREKESLRSGKLCPRTIKDQTSKQDSFCALRKYLDSGYAFLSIKQ